MATIKSPSMHDRVYVGAHGNHSMALAKVALKAAAVGDVVEMLELPIGLHLTGVRIHTAGLGAGVKVDIVSGDKVLAEGVDVAAVTDKSVLFTPEYNEEKRVLKAVIKGAKATGVLHLNPEYVVTGY